MFRYQVRKWSQTYRSRARVRLSPVLPVVFHTDVRRWPQVGTLVDLIARGEKFRAVTPIIEQPLFLNLPKLAASELERDGGFFGWVLRLVQQRRSRACKFLQFVERVVAHLDAMAPADRTMYDQREKAQRDYQWAIEGAREEGEAHGVLIGSVVTLQRIAGDSETDVDELKKLDKAALNRLMSDLQERLRARGT